MELSSSGFICGEVLSRMSWVTEENCGNISPVTGLWEDISTWNPTTKPDCYLHEYDFQFCN